MPLRRLHVHKYAYKTCSFFCIFAHRQHQTEDPERRREIMAAAGRVSWAKLSKEEQDARVARMHEGRRRWLEGRRHAT